MPKLHIFKNEKETCKAFADWLTDHLAEALHGRPRFTIALPQDDLPKSLYKTLTTEYLEKIAWDKLDFFMANENASSSSAEKSDRLEFLQTLQSQKKIAEAQIHLLGTGQTLEIAAQHYNQLLHSALGNDSSLDLVILNLAEDGSSLTLLPNEDQNFEAEQLVAHVQTKNEDESAITLTPSTINNAKVKAFLVTGKKKEEAVQQVLKGKYDPERVPAQLIQTANKTVHWFLDEAAASRLIKPTP